MEPVSVKTVVCPACESEVPADADRCAKCGVLLSAGPAGAARRSVRRSLREDVVDNPWAVLGVLFVAAGVLGLPVLWRSRAFSTVSKLLLSAAVSVYSTLILLALGWILWRTIHLVSPLFAAA
jgi:hypothetical protein